MRYNTKWFFHQYGPEVPQVPTLTQLSSNLTEIVIYAAIALVTLTGLC